MHNAKEILRAALMLTLICAVVVAALAGVNALTKDVIADAEAAAVRENCENVLPAAKEAGATFEENMLDDSGKAVSYYEATANGDTVGYVFLATVTGKSSGLKIMTGVDATGAVTGVKIVDNSETAGYPAKVEKGGLFERLLGVTADHVDGVDAVSQATKTSNGIKAGVKEALRYFEEVTQNG
ncbi:MAG: FMN-binding protein [Clostridia bacterium]|nr:FMN-binding protein [Clostridia bacterium]